MTKRQKSAMPIKYLIPCCLLVFYGFITNASAKDKVALVIGNGTYLQMPLNNALNDAHDMAVAFESIGFEVILKTDLNRADTLRALREFSNRLHKDSIGVFYYSGHALQYQHDNYLLPIDAESTENIEQISRTAVPVARILEEIDIVENETNILILDACRTHPTYQGQADISPGLAKMTAPPGTLIAYSTTPGKVAQDGSNSNSPYTQHLKQLITTPNLLVEQLFNRVRDAVMRDTNNQQVPSEQSYLRDDFYFAGQVDEKTLAALETERLLEKFRQSEAEKRAEQQQHQVKTQLARCQTYESQHKLSTQTQESALSCYQQVLEQDIDNEIALARLASLERRYLSWTDSAIRHQAWEKAQLYLQVLSRINAQNNELNTLKTRLQQGKQTQKENQQIDEITDQLLNQNTPQTHNHSSALKPYWQVSETHIRLLPNRDFVFYLPANLEQLWLSTQIEALDTLPNWLKLNPEQLSLSGHTPSDTSQLALQIQLSAESQTAEKQILNLSISPLPSNESILSLALPTLTAEQTTGALHEIVLRCLQSMPTFAIDIETIPTAQALAGLHSQRYSAFFSLHAKDNITLDTTQFLRSIPLPNNNANASYLLIAKHNPQARRILWHFNQSLKRLEQQGIISEIQQRYS